jgi:hypothetical protein
MEAEEQNRGLTERLDEKIEATKMNSSGPKALLEQNWQLKEQNEALKTQCCDRDIARIKKDHNSPGWL